MVKASTLSYSNNLLNKHLFLLMTLCAISVPGTRDAGDANKKAWPCLCGILRQVQELTRKQMLRGKQTKVLGEMRKESRQLCLEVG